MEFILGCLKLRGAAKSVDLFKLQRETTRLHASLTDMKQILMSLAANSGGGPPPASLLRPQSYDSMPDLDTQRMRSTIPASRLSTLTVSPRLAKGKHDHANRAKGQIRMPSTREHAIIVQDAELRAMRISELHGVVTVIESQCREQGWRNVLSGELLEPDDVNLYDFCHHVISPATAPESLTLMGLNAESYRRGQHL